MRSSQHLKRINEGSFPWYGAEHNLFKHLDEILINESNARKK